MREKNLSILLLYAAFMLFLFKAEAQAAILSATVSVEGMACPFCAYGVEKKLKSVAGVESISISMKEGTAHLSARDGESIDIIRVPSAIKEAGFTPGTISIVVVGRVEAGDRNRLFLKFNEAERGLLLTDLKDDIREELLVHERTGTHVELKGSAQMQSDGSWTLSPDSVEKVDDIQ